MAFRASGLDVPAQDAKHARVTRVSRALPLPLIAQAMAQFPTRRSAGHLVRDHRQMASNGDIGPERERDVAILWREALSEYRQEGLQGRLSNRWPGDRNITERIAYRFPPTFQPGYVGPNYFAGNGGLLLVGQNPGEGSDPTSVAMDRDYLGKLHAFMVGDAGLAELNRLVASHMRTWRLFAQKGIFHESGAARISLLDDDVRPSIEDVGYINYFPFKTSGNAAPLKSSAFRRGVWVTYVSRMVELLTPSVIVPLGAWCGPTVEAELRGSAGSPEVIPVWHPSDYNLNTRPRELGASWASLSAALRALG
jgi:Uracil DNA glycosylase superfamily